MGPTTLVDSSRVPRRQLFKSGVEPMTEELREATYLRGKLHKVKDVAVGFLTCGPETLKVYGCPPMPQVDWQGTEAYARHLESVAELIDSPDDLAVKAFVWMRCRGYYPKHSEIRDMTVDDWYKMKVELYGGGLAQSYTGLETL